VSYVIAEPCEGVKDATCVQVCPVECIESNEESQQYFINPEVCIECEQCVLVCPVNAIHLEKDLLEEWQHYTARNAAFFADTKEGVMAVSYEQASRMIQAAHQKARDLQVAVTVAVVDEAGRIIATGRMDEARPLTIDLAIGKAYTSSFFQMATHDMAVMTKEPAFSQSLTALSISTGGRVLAVGGGLPILRGGAKVIGGVGVAGGTEEQDVECSRAALGSVNL